MTPSIDLVQEKTIKGACRLIGFYSFFVLYFFHTRIISPLESGSYRLKLVHLEKLIIHLSAKTIDSDYS